MDASIFSCIKSAYRDDLKKVRKNLFRRIGDQLPWENSCLIDNFCFNYGQLDPYLKKHTTGTAILKNFSKVVTANSI